MDITKEGTHYLNFDSHACSLKFSVPSLRVIGYADFIATINTWHLLTIAS